MSYFAQYIKKNITGSYYKPAFYFNESLLGRGKRARKMSRGEKTAKETKPPEQNRVITLYHVRSSNEVFRTPTHLL